MSSGHWRPKPQRTRQTLPLHRAATTGQGALGGEGGWQLTPASETSLVGWNGCIRVHQGRVRGTPRRPDSPTPQESGPLPWRARTACCVAATRGAQSSAKDTSRTKATGCRGTHPHSECCRASPMDALAHAARANVRGGWICMPELLSADAASCRQRCHPLRFACSTVCRPRVARLRTNGWLADAAGKPVGG